MHLCADLQAVDLRVSMKSGLEGRNNKVEHEQTAIQVYVSMKSGLEGRNNHGDSLRAVLAP